MNLVGWNILPDGFAVEFKFEKSPKWLKVLALTPYFERFAYPIAVKRGFGFLRNKVFSADDPTKLESAGWILLTSEKTKEDEFFEGSRAVLSSNPKEFQRPHFSFTRWGRVRASRRYVHKLNGTYSHFKDGTLPQGL